MVISQQERMCIESTASRIFGPKRERERERERNLHENGDNFLREVLQMLECSPRPNLLSFHV